MAVISPVENENPGNSAEDVGQGSGVDDDVPAAGSIHWLEETSMNTSALFLDL